MTFQHQQVVRFSELKAQLKCVSRQQVAIVSARRVGECNVTDEEHHGTWLETLQPCPEDGCDDSDNIMVLNESGP